MTVITITTVGFLEVHPLGPAGRLFTMTLALGGVFTAFYAAAEFIRAVVTGEIRTVLGRQRMESLLAQLSGHLVICGFGRMGRLVAEEFSAPRPALRRDRPRPPRARGLLDPPRHPPRGGRDRGRGAPEGGGRSAPARW